MLAHANNAWMLQNGCTNRVPQLCAYLRLRVLKTNPKTLEITGRRSRTFDMRGTVGVTVGEFPLFYWRAVCY